MFEKFLSNNVGDFRQRYEGTYGFYYDRETNIRKLALLSRVDVDCPPYCVHFTFENNVKFHIHADTKRDIGFEFLPPRSAFYNTEKGTFYVERIAARQFYRGIKSTNTAIYTYDGGSWRSIKLGFEPLIAIYERNIPLYEAIQRYKENKLSVALTPSIAIAGNLLQVNMHICGKITENKLKILDTGELFLPEIKQAITSSGLGLEIATNE